VRSVLSSVLIALGSHARTFVAGFVVAIFLCAGVICAQNVNATLSGTVSDISGAVIPNATVLATAIDTGVVTKTSTNGTGAYAFPSLQAGRYRVSAEMSGFKTIAFEPVVLDVSAQVRLNFTLPVSGGSTTLEVTAAAESPLLASSAVVGGVVQGQQILDLPLIDRSANNLAISQAGFAGGVGTGVNVAGGTTQSLLTTLNGISVTNNRLTRAGGLNSFQLSQSVDLVEEVRVVSSPSDVELGRALGQVQMIVRSGTNTLRGSVVDGLRNTDLNANTFFNNYSGLSRQILKRNQFAGRLGGPIRKNKTFFFFLYDGNRQRTSASSNYTVLTTPARQGTFRFYPGVLNGNAIASVPTVDLNGNPIQPANASGSLQSVSLFGVDPNHSVADPTGTVQKLIAATPSPNNYLVGDGLNTAGYQWQIPSYSDRDQFTFKVDHYFSQNHHMNVVVTHEHNYYTSTAPVYPTENVSGISQVHSWFASLGFTSTIGPALLNEFKLGMQHPDIRQIGGTSAYPQVYPSTNGTLWTPTFVSGMTSPIPANIDSELIDPVYTIGDSVSWNRGRHSFKFGFQADYFGSNSFNINNNVVPLVTLGFGGVAVTGVSAISGIGSNQTNAQNLLADLSGALASVNEGFGVGNGKNPQWIPYPNRRAWLQRDASGFAKDDIKVSPDLTVNVGVRWDYVSVPYDKWGRMLYPVNGFAGVFGISGTNSSALWTPGASSGSMTTLTSIGPNSQNPGQHLYNPYYKGFGPGAGFSWSIPYFGKNKTVFRMGYGITRPPAQSFLGIDGSFTSFGTSATYVPSTACGLNCLNLPLSPINNNPFAVVPLTDRTQTFTQYDPNFMQPFVQNWNASLERQLTSTLTLSVRYVGNRSTHLVTGTSLNSSNIFENGILSAFQTTIAGGNAPLFDQIFNGLNLGLGAVNGATVTGSQSVRQYSATKAYFANNSPGAFASWLNTTNALTGTNGGLLSRAGLPQNFVVVNPQYASANEIFSAANASYNSGIVELRKQFSNGFAFQTNLTWAKTLLQGDGALVNGAVSDSTNTYRDPRSWHLDKALAAYNVKLAWKATGTYMLPFGPGKEFVKTGFLSKILDQWQFGTVLTVYSGNPLQITASNGYPFTATGTGASGPPQTAQAAGAVPSNLGSVTRVGNGVVYFPGLTQVTDPSCAGLTTLQGLQGSCTMKAMALNGNVILANALPGTVGNMPLWANLTGPSLFDLDMNLLKRVRIKERVDVEFRVDGIAITNTPHFANPTTNIDSTNFGRITAPASNGSNQFTMPTQYNGNRVFVANLRVSF